MSAVIVVVSPEELRALIREEVRAALAPAPEPEALYMRVSEFAEWMGVSERHVWSLVKQGLPTIGAGRARRVETRSAVEWMRGQHEQVDDAVERDARRAARRAATRAT